MIAVVNFTTDIKVVIPSKLSSCPALKNMKDMQEPFVKDWASLALADVGFLSGILIIACRHLCICHYRESYFRQLAMEYKVTCVRSLRQAIASSRPFSSNSAVSRGLALAFDEVSQAV